MQQIYQIDAFAASIPSYLGCSDDFGNVIHLPRAEALKHAHIAPNPKAFINCMMFDVDTPEAGAAWIDADLPQPNWICQNPANGHAHLGYALLAPVSRTLKARGTPQRYLARIQHAMTGRLGADRAYTHYLTKTPSHPRWRTIWGWGNPYTLDQLREPLAEDLPLRIRRTEAVGEGRNVVLFDGLRFWAYRARLGYHGFGAWFDACLQHAEGLNAFACPLPYSETRATAKSVAKWTWTHITPEGFAARQAARGRKSGAKRQAESIDIQGELLL